MLSNSEILRIAAEQSAEDIGCSAEDFFKSENVIVPFSMGEGARKYYKEPISCNFVSYGNNVVVSVKDELRDIAEEYISKFEFYHLFETPNVHWLSERLAPLSQKVCFMAEYYLPNTERLKKLPCKYEMRLFHQSDFKELYLPQWSNALCADRRELDVLGIGAYDGDTLAGLAGCSADCGGMWQIGIDVLREYRGQGIGSALTAKLAAEIFERGKVPFYCSAWSNIRSVRNAVKAGFVPAWVEMTVKNAEIVDAFNK